MNIDWITFVTSIILALITSGVVTAFINHRTQIHAIKESGLYAKRAEVLDELMQRIERLNRLTGEFISPLQIDGSAEADEERRKKVNDAFDKFSGYYQDHLHYLPKKLTLKIKALREKYGEMLADFYEIKYSTEKIDRKRWSEIVHKYNDVPFTKERENVIEEFRKMIGVK